MKKQLLLSALLLVVACAKGPDKDTKAAEETFKEIENAETMTCNGEGSEFSGLYSIEADTGKGKCSDNEEGGDILGVGFTINCTQNNSSFNCKTRDDVSLDGCINKDGSFSITSKTDLNSFDKLTRTRNAEKSEKLTVLKGSIQNDSGNASLKYSSVVSRGKQKKGCNFNWEVQMELHHKAE